MKILLLNPASLLRAALLCCLYLLFSTSSAYAQEASASELEAQQLLTSAEAKIQQNQFKQALVLLGNAHQIIKQEKDSPTARAVLNSMATVYYSTGQLEQAQRYYSELVEKDELEEDWAALSVSLYNLAHVFGSQQQFTLATQHFERSLQLSRQINDHSGASYSLKAIGVNFQAQNDFYSAEAYLEEALLGFEALGDDRQIAIILRNLGDIEEAFGNYARAIAYYKEALPVLAAYSLDGPLTRTYRGLSQSYAQLFEYENAYIAYRAYTQLLQQQLEQQSLEDLQRLQVEFETQLFAEKNEQLEQQTQAQTQELEHRQNLLKMQYLVLVMAAGIIILSLGLLLRSRQYAQKMRLLATTDELTGLLNRRAIMQFGTKEWLRSERSKRPLFCLMIDIDHFKSINDNYGHAAGDQVLISVAHALKSTLRQTDALGRFGGEEFLLLATEIELPQAEILAERIRKKVEEISHEIIANKKITISVGLAQISNETCLEDLIKHADEALYQAKNEGRNQVIIFTAQEKLSFAGL